VQNGHLDHKGKQVINNGVEELVGHLAPGQMRHTLQLVVQVQLQAAEATSKSTAIYASAFWSYDGKVMMLWDKHVEQEDHS
jgi:hypothetical protein